MSEYFSRQRGGEYFNEAFREQLQKDETLHETSTPYTPEQNRLAEWMNQMLSHINEAFKEQL
ncbi:hypothetical protein PAXRUDRAFT_22136 [Paxillus rubicundulus Ve08.2h10]|uniref:Integrase catalytic domain-containing protein n=1 Tax=Paxillus rubicundulus Ve08.2h10 TaxID=930991 RepID=A0A0D0CNK0_9AGAM|nr:hypothetical protein PAXRUDRAFT_22136 [Paxillus rubicundulus Ve08.2h10]